MRWLAELGIYLRDVINNWAGYATGGIIVAMIWLRSVLQPSWKPPKRFSLALASLFLFLAGFQAWREQYQRAETAQDSIKLRKAEPTIQVNVPPPTVIFSSTNTASNTAPKFETVSPKSPRFILSDEHARLVVTHIVQHPPSGSFTFPYFNIRYINGGKLPAVGVLRRQAIAISNRELSLADVAKLRMTNSMFSASDLKGLDSDDRELYPNSPSAPQVDFISLPNNPSQTLMIDALTKALPDVTGGRTYLYIAVAFVYRDRLLQPGMYIMRWSRLFGQNFGRS